VIEKIALRLLSIKSRSHTELKKKLLDKGFSLSAIIPLLARYQQLGYINDDDLTQRKAASLRNKGYGPRWIQGKLRQIGLKAPHYPLSDQKAAIRRLLATPPFQKKSPTQKMAALQRRGFDLEAILVVVNHCLTVD
jgi:SOS response regulatory protein OraA/RecX